VKAIVDDKAKYTDWSQRDDIKAELKVDLILVLAEARLSAGRPGRGIQRNFRAGGEL
jgi:hypothetical protein